MLHIAFAELMRGSAEQMLAGEGRLGVHQRHHVLQLVAESVGTAGLIKPRAAPESAAQGLIQQPAVRQHIHGRIGCIHIHRAEGPIPIFPDTFERHAAGVCRAKSPDQMSALQPRCDQLRGENSCHVPAHPASQRRLARHRTDPVPRRFCRKGVRASAPLAGDRLPFLPMNSFRSPVSVRVASFTSRNTMRSGNSVL